jgi:putative SOS response-associated peptidase YedK
LTVCGRFTLTTSAEALAEQFELVEVPAELAPRYNVAPAQEVAAVRVLVQGQGRRVQLLHWGLVPSWAKDTKIGYRTINARSESVETKPSFRAAYRERRCLVLADGFYEWQQQGSTKQPYLIRRKDGEPFAIAGLWECWENPEGEPLESCTLLTCEANALVAKIHDRMPVILQPGDYDLWLDPEQQDPAQLGPLLQPYPADQMEMISVSPRVNSPRHDDPLCMQPYGNLSLFDD